MRGSTQLTQTYRFPLREILSAADGGQSGRQWQSASAEIDKQFGGVIIAPA